MARFRIFRNGPKADSAAPGPFDRIGAWLDKRPVLEGALWLAGGAAAGAMGASLTIQGSMFVISSVIGFLRPGQVEGGKPRLRDRFRSAVICTAGTVGLAALTPGLGAMIGTAGGAMYLADRRNGRKSPPPAP